MNRSQIYAHGKKGFVVSPLESRKVINANIPLLRTQQVRLGGLGHEFKIITMLQTTTTTTATTNIKKIIKPC